MKTDTTDRIEKHVLIRAPLTRVWQALTDAERFGEWFRVNLKGRKFEAGTKVSGPLAEPGYEHLIWRVTVERMEPEHLFSFRWHPAAIDPAVDYSLEPTTLVEFALAETDGGTLLRVTESGFDALPAERRAEAFRMDSQGWAIQMKRIEAYVGRQR